jgi:4-azaleucine resistance transporter AzlC
LFWFETHTSKSLEVFLNALQDHSTVETLRDGAAAAWPICIGYIPIGLALGVIAQKTGLSPLETGLMSLLVFAGSSQFIAVSMLAAGAEASAIIMTTFMVNLRHLLMSSSLAVFLPRTRRLKIGLFAYGVTDESFAINYSRFAYGDWDINKGLVLNQTANLTWITSTVFGAYGGQFIPAHAFGIDYALIAMFICLLVYQLKGGVFWLTAALSGLIATLVALWLPGNAHIVIASILAAGVGVFIKRARGKR